MADRYCVREGNKALHEYHDPAKATVTTSPKLAIGDIGLEPEFALVEDEVVFKNTLYVIIPEEEVDRYFLLAVLNSRLTFHAMQSLSPTVRGGYLRYKTQYLERLPIRKIDFVTEKQDRQQYVEQVRQEFDTYVASRTESDRSKIVKAILDHMEAQRFDVAHDVLALLAREMVRLTARRKAYVLDITDYVTEPTGKTGLSLREIGNLYQPAPGSSSSILADTTENREALRIGKLIATKGGDTVNIAATARFKPSDNSETDLDCIPENTELDQWGYIESNPIGVCTLNGCSDIESTLVMNWLGALNRQPTGFSNFRGTATKTKSLLNRIYDLLLPDPTVVTSALQAFSTNLRAATELDEKIDFSNSLIDSIVYDLYALSPQQVDLVEGRISQIDAESVELVQSSEDLS